jgi:hypothetical protein
MEKEETVEASAVEAEEALMETEEAAEGMMETEEAEGASMEREEAAEDAESAVDIKRDTITMKLLPIKDTKTNSKHQLEKVMRTPVKDKTSEEVSEVIVEVVEGIAEDTTIIQKVVTHSTETKIHQVKMMKLAQEMRVNKDLNALH